MEKDENINVKLFGFEINYTTATIIFYFALITIISLIPSLYYYGNGLIVWLSESTISEILSDILSTLYSFGNVLLLINIEGISLYILIKSILIKKFITKPEKTSTRWFGFLLTKTSLTILLILAIVNILLHLNMLYRNIIIFTPLSPSLPSRIQIFYLSYIITAIILILIEIYTLIVCIGNRKDFK